MRLLHVVATEKRRGAEMFASDLIPALNRAGVSQRVVVLRGMGKPRLWDAPTTVVKANGWQVPGLRIDVHVLSALRGEIAGWKPSVVQAHGGESLKYAILASTGLGNPVVYRRIGSANPWITGRVRRAAHGSLMRQAARVVAVAEAIRQETVERFMVPARQVVTIHNGVDVHRMEPSDSREAIRERMGIPQAAPVLISVGALSWEKDPFAQVEIASRVIRERTQTVHLIVGEGPLRGDLETEIRRRRLQDRVRLLGSRSDVAELLHASDLLLLASQTEGMPACLIEAGMVGIPIVAYSVAGVPEVVIEGTTGLLASPGDLETLTAMVLQVLGDERARRAMGKAAREHCRERFDIRTIAPLYLDLYREIAA